MSDDEKPTVAEQLVHDLYLAPALHLDHGRLQAALEKDIDETAARAKVAKKPTRRRDGTPSADGNLP